MTAGTNCCPWIVPLHFEYGRPQIRKATTISRPHLENERGRYSLVIDNRGVRAHGEKLEHRLAWISYPPVPSAHPCRIRSPSTDAWPTLWSVLLEGNWKQVERFEWSLNGPWVYLSSDSFIHPCWCRFFSALQIHLSLSCPWHPVTSSLQRCASTNAVLEPP